MACKESETAALDDIVLADIATSGVVGNVASRGGAVLGAEGSTSLGGCPNCFSARR